MAMTPAFFDAVRASLFGGSLAQPQVEGIEIIVSTWERAGDGDDRKLAYLLATAFHETARTMQPIAEYGKGKGRKYGTPVNGKVYYGRGYVQLTWDYNYARAKKELGADFVDNPELALDKKHAADIMINGMTQGWFTGKKLSDYFTISKNDPVNARRIINGTDKAKEIAAHHEAFLHAIKVANG